MVFNSAILFLADGARYDVFTDLLNKGHLPNIQKHIVERGTITCMKTTFPSTTGPAYLPFLTGCFPGTCDIPGIRWFDRELFHKEGLSKNSYRSYVGVQTYLINEDIDNSIQTIFEFVDYPINIFNSITRGDDVGGNLYKSVRNLLWTYGFLTTDWGTVDLGAEKLVLKTLKSNADFIFAVYPSIDTLSHLYTPTSGKVIRAYRRFDRSIGKIVRRLKKEGRYDDTLLMVLSDHGLSTTHTHYDVARYLDVDLNIETLYHPTFNKQNFRAVAMVSGNGMANLYFNCSTWDRRPQHSDIENEYHIVEELLRQEAVDMVITRENPFTLRVSSTVGTAYIGEGDDGVINYQVEGGDPFGYDELPDELTYRDVLSLTYDTDYPDAPVQLLQHFRSKRAGDVVISARVGYDLREKYEHPDHRATHGSLHREHIDVPLILNAEIDDYYIRSVDVFPTTLRLMGKPVPAGIDGKSLIEMPYRAGL